MSERAAQRAETGRCRDSYHWDGYISSGYPLKLHFQIPCVLPVQLQIFPVPMYVVHGYYINKTDLADFDIEL